jgi:hypothetical protein
MVTYFMVFICIKEKWVHVTAGNQQGIPITGWVNLKQAHIKQISPWHWHGFNTVEEKATLGELSKKRNHRRRVKQTRSNLTLST